MASKTKKKNQKNKPLFNFEKEINTIIQHIEPRIYDMRDRFARGVQDEATMFAFWIGLGGDLDEALSKLKKRKK